MTVKDKLIEAAQSMGFERLVVGSLEPMTAGRARYEGWLADGHAADMDYLKRDPHFRTSPQFLYPGSRSVLIVSASYYSEVQPAPGPLFGRVARYAAGLDYHAVLRRKLRELKALIEEKIGRPLLSKTFTDDVALYEPGLAKRHGLGFQGRNTMIIGPRLMGSYNFIGELFTDLAVEPDLAYVGTCGKCTRCVSDCPTSAILPEGKVDAKLCISYLTIENKGGVPRHLREQLGSWVFGCDICQEICPYNQRPPETKWIEFRPQSGVGHYLDLLALLEIKDEDEFRKRFGLTPLRRPKRRGLLRNALVVLGNQFAAGAETDYVESAIKAVAHFAEQEQEPMLREHAAWALAQSGRSSAKGLLERLWRAEDDDCSRQLLCEYILQVSN